MKPETEKYLKPAGKLMTNAASRFVETIAKIAETPLQAHETAT